MLILIAILFPMIMGIIISLSRLSKKGKRISYAAALLVTDSLAILSAILSSPISPLTFSSRVTLSFGFDGLGRFFLSAVLILYTAVLFYAFEYMEAEEDETLFFAFYLISLGAMISLSASRNMISLYLSFEFATLSTVPLVLHERSKEAIAAGLKYLFYSIAGALMGILGIFFLYFYGMEDCSFRPGGFLDPQKVAGNEGLLCIFIFIGILGFGTKAGLYPMHGWLPTAHPIAPAPASSLLSGIIAKAGILAVIRFVFFSSGTDIIRGSWVQYTWLCLAMVTIFMGSMMAFQEKNLKKRLAYSSVSQISYIMLGLSLLSEEGAIGGLLHLLSHMAAKGCLFLTAGVFIVKLGKRMVPDLKGLGRSMPITMWCFFLSSLSLVGIPPMGGFVSKWFLSSAAIGDGMGVFAYLPPIILLVSALLTAGYLFPPVINAFFPGQDFSEHKEIGVHTDNPSGQGEGQAKDPSIRMCAPMIVLCILSLCIGLFGNVIAENLSGFLAACF
ncbi:MAG: proton-conducting membrane transporter [Lachnospiraceae bacterium]|nr:proton-conducting membrane transporter [Lachnospiraceae bacterium]